MCIRKLSQIYPDALEKACADIFAELGRLGEINSAALRSIVRRACLNHSLPNIPSNEEILAHADSSVGKNIRLALVKRPIKTASGIAVIAVMPMPYGCPHGRCTYCPGGPASGTPNSYTGNEPIAAGATSVSFDPRLQVSSGLLRLESFGHDISKIEIVIVGGTFLFMPSEYRVWFAKSCYDALNGSASLTLEQAKTLNESASSRCVGFTIETKPDYCKRPHVDAMLEYGATRVEIGIQCLRDRVYRIVNRGHTYNDVIESLQISRDAGYKIAAHMMPGLPTMSVADDIADFDRLWNDAELRPDMLKIYPSLVIPNTPLYDDYVSGKYVARDEQDMVDMLAQIKARIPRWVRIMRVQREIASTEIAAGVRSGNLRQAVFAKMKHNGTRCMCIRCREAGIAGINTIPKDGLELVRTDYDASGGREVFLSMEDTQSHVYAYLRLRKPSSDAHRQEINSDTCIVRELHTLGRQLKIGTDSSGGIQHSGLGTKLLRKAENIALDDFDSRRLLVISAVGTRQYYAKLDYELFGAYMSKDLRT